MLLIPLQIIHYRQDQSEASETVIAFISVMAASNDISLDLREERET